MSIQIESNMKVCQYCGKSFFSYAKNRKFCSYSCSKFAKYKKYSINITNDEFNKLFRKFDAKIKKLILARIRRGVEFESIYQDSLISLWLCALRYKEKGKNIFDMTTQYVVRTIVGAIQKANGRDIADVRRLTKHVGEICSLDLTVFDDGETTLLDTLNDSRLPIEKIIDSRNLITKIMYEGLIDENVRFAVLKAEEDYGKSRRDIYEEVMENYGITNISSTEFSEKALIGSKKLYSKYSDEIKDCINITEKDLKFKPYPAVKAEPRICKVCGKIFISKYGSIHSCSKECADLLSNSIRNQKCKQQQLEKLQADIERLRKEKQQLKIEVNNKKQAMKYYQEKIK